MSCYEWTKSLCLLRNGVVVQRATYTKAEANLYAGTLYRMG